MEKEKVKEIIEYVKKQVNQDISPYITDTRKRDYINLHFNFMVYLNELNRSPVIKDLIRLKNAYNGNGLIKDIQENGCNDIALYIRK